jgi:hypothetical protein
MKRWIQSCRRELPDRTLICNQAHPLPALHQYEQHYNTHRPHRGIANARPLHPLSEPITNPNTITPLNIHRHDRIAASSTNIDMRPDLRGQGFRHPQGRCVHSELGHFLRRLGR